MKPKNVIVLLVVALVCLGAWFLIPGGGGTHDDGDRLPPVWPSISKSDVTSLVISTKARRLELRKRQGADRWDAVEGTNLVRADANGVDDLLAAVTRQSVRDKIPAGSEGAGLPKEYGLDEPILEIAVTALSKTTTLRYGKRSREGTNVYVDSGEGTDVWLVPKDASDLAINGLASGLRSKHLFDQTAFDVSKLEIVKGGVTTAEFHRDTTQLWTMSQPWKGYPNPKEFDKLLSDIVNAEVDAWTEFGAPDLAKYGLANPTCEIRVTGRGDLKKTETLLVGACDGSGAFVMEPGTGTVVHVGPRFAAAVTADPMTYRDRSFTRLGRDGVAVEVHVGDANYRLEKAGASWDAVIGTNRRPADGQRVQDLLDRLATWQTKEFLDAQKPEDFGLTDKDFIEITRQSVGTEPGVKIVLFVAPGSAKRPDAGSVYGRRKDDGALERVEAEPLQMLLRGAEQFFRRTVAELPIDAIDEISRDPGFGERGKDVQMFKVRRDLGAAKPVWKWEITGNLGAPAGAGISAILGGVRTIEAVEWIAFTPEKDNERMGFRPPAAETFVLGLRLANTVGLDPDPKLYVGKRRPEGGYYARYFSKEGATNWAFVLSDDAVKVLSAPVEVVTEEPPK